MAAVFALHGLRRSELLALDKKDVDISAGTISVHGAAVMDEDNNLVRKRENKNISSNRIVPIMIPRLKELVEASSGGPLVTIPPNKIWYYINSVCQNANLPKVGVHGLRHSFASLAYHLGLSERETMEIGGWVDQNTMRKIYTHLAQSDRLKSANKMAEFYNSISSSSIT
ncbi:MAG: site-specific integrase [Clostridiales bacterium]|nr:site-specific integrase [Clostridiales bacterium]